MPSPVDAGAAVPRRRALLALALGALLPSVGRAGEPYPSRPIRVVVPFAVGGTIDLIGRAFAPLLAERLGQQVIIDAKPGANGVIGTELVANAPGDGYTLLLVTGSFAVNPSIYRKLRYDVMKDFKPITSVARSSGMLVLVNPAVPVRSVRELIELSHQPGVDLNYASPGIGNTIHLATELFRHHTGARLTHIPYKGNGPAVNALLANEVQLMFIPPPVVMPHVRAGKLRPIAFAGPERLPDLPDVPTMAEAGVSEYEFGGSWISLFAPSATPQAVVDRLYAELGPLLRSDAMKSLLDTSAPGYLLDGRSPNELAADLKADIRRYADIIRFAGIEPL